MKIHRLLEEFIKYNEEISLFPRRQSPLHHVFIDFHDSCEGVLNQKLAEELLELMELMDLTSDFFLFHLLGAFERAPLKCLEKILLRLRCYDNTLLYNVSIYNLRRIYGFIELDKCINSILLSSDSSIEQLHILKMYRYCQDDGRNYDNFTWVGTHYKIPLDKSSVPMSMKRQEMIKDRILQRGDIILKMILDKDGPKQIIQMLNYIFPRKENIFPSSSELYEKAKKKLGR